MTQYAILRNKKIGLQDRKWGNVRKAEGHNVRDESQMVNEKDQDHIHSDMTEYNQTFEYGSGKNLVDKIKNRIAEAGVKRKLAPDAVVAVESIMTTSPEYWEDNWRDLVKQKDPAIMEKLDKWSKKSIKAGENFYGKDNIVSVDLHLDETTPHLHIIAVPIIEHNNKIKLAAKYLYTPEKLREWQSAYAADMSEFKLERGIEGSKAKHVHFTEHKKEMDLRATVEAELKAKDQDQVQRAYAAGVNVNKQAALQWKAEAERWKAEAEQERLVGQGLKKKISRLEPAITEFIERIDTLEAVVAEYEQQLSQERSTNASRAREEGRGYSTAGLQRLAAQTSQRETTYTSSDGLSL